MTNWNVKFKELKLTKFTQQVLFALLKIPKGQVRSYAQVSKMVKHPRAMRAVGTVCKRNPFPILIPCHRVVTAKFLTTHNQNDVGFYSAGGKTKKIELLRKENIHFN